MEHGSAFDGHPLSRCREDVMSERRIDIDETKLVVYDEEEYGQVDQEDRDALREKLHDQTRLGEDE